MKYSVLFTLLVLAFVGCNGEDAEQTLSRNPPQEGLSANFTSLGCAASSCHGADGKQGLNLLHDPNGNPITNLSKSARDLESWTSWVRFQAKSPMPRYTEDQYSESDLKNDYTHLTGRSD